MPNLYQELKTLLAPGRVQTGKVLAYADGMATIELPGGAQIRARGDTTVGARVFVQDGVVQGSAPDLEVLVDVV